jgi:phosphoribosylamine---glycine ligase
VRFGDPETQSLLLLLKSDLAQLCLSCVSSSLQHQPFDIEQGYACNIVISSAGYPGPYKTGHEIKTDQVQESKLWPH